MWMGPHIHARRELRRALVIEEGERAHQARRNDGSSRRTEPRVFSRVAPDTDQRTRISTLRSQIMATRDEHGRRIAKMRGQLASAIMREPQDQALVDSILHNIAASQASVQQAAVDHVLAVRAVLRPDQRPAFEEMITSHMRSGGPMECVLGH